MVSIPSPQPQIQEQQLRKRIAALEAEVRRLKPYEQQVMFENALFANAHISPTHRLTLRECLFGKQKIRVNELTGVNPFDQTSVQVKLCGSESMPPQILREAHNRG